MADERQSFAEDSCLKVDHYRLIGELIERGLELGWRRAHKHVAAPEKDAIMDKQHDAIMAELCEYYRFSDA